MTFDQRIQGLVDRVGVSLSSHAVSQLATYYQLLERWNRRINLTALPLDDFPRRTFERLLLEPIAATCFLPAPHNWLDLGTGGGSPAVPMKVIFRDAHLTMVESRSRKRAFLRQVVRELGLADTTVYEGRIEDLGASLGSADLITARALRLTNALWKSVERLLSEGGQFAFFGGVSAPAASGSLRLQRSHRLPVDDSSVHIFSRSS
jgi:16S rRNA (guanine527-N7)-methyltransferase